MSELFQKQVIFSQLAARLLLKAAELGYQVTLGETTRDPRVAHMNQALGKGISNSLHLVRLAIDVNLFKDGHDIVDDEGHRDLGEWWEEQHPDACAGFRFGDANHYSLSFDGRK